MCPKQVWVCAPRNAKNYGGQCERPNDLESILTQNMLDSAFLKQFCTNPDIKKNQHAQKNGMKLSQQLCRSFCDLAMENLHRQGYHYRSKYPNERRACRVKQSTIHQINPRNSMRIIGSYPTFKQIEPNYLDIERAVTLRMRDAADGLKQDLREDVVAAGSGGTTKPMFRRARRRLSMPLTGAW